MDYIGITMEDNSIFDQSELSTKPIKTENGSVVQPNDPAYKSTLFFMFLNKVNRIVKAKYPDVKIVTFAYLFTDEPPVCDIDKNIQIMYAPLSECDRHPFNADEKTCKSNFNYNQKLLKWVGKTDNLIIYNYYGSFDADVFERPIEEKVQADLQYYKKLGIKGLIPEGMIDAYGNNKVGWGVNAMRFWIINKLFWNPDLNIQTLREEYLQKTYGKAADFMRTYADLIEKGWKYDEGHIGWQVTGLSLFSQYILKAGIAGECLKTLDEALAVADANVKPRIEIIKKVFETNIAKTPSLETQTAKAIKTTALKADILNTADFSSGAWKNAIPITDFRVSVNTKILALTKVYLLWDNENFYVGYENSDSNVSKTFASDSIVDGWWANDDDVETFVTGDITGNTPYYSLMSNAKSLQLVFSSIDRASINPVWQCRSIIKTGGWNVIQAIPFRSIGVNINNTRQLKAQFFRTYHIDGAAYFCGWFGGSVWNSIDMKLIQLTENQ